VATHALECVSGHVRGAAVGIALGTNVEAYRVYYSGANITDLRLGQERAACGVAALMSV